MHQNQQQAIGHASHQVVGAGAVHDVQSLLARMHQVALEILDEHANVRSFEIRVEGGCHVVAVAFIESPWKMHGEAGSLYVDGMGDTLTGEIALHEDLCELLCDATATERIFVYRTAKGVEVAMRDASGLETVATEPVQEFRFKAVRSRKANGGQYDPGRFVVVRLTQTQFEDHHYRKERVLKAIVESGIDLNESPVWSEAPLVDHGFEEKLRAAIGAGGDAKFLAYYAHGFHHRHYRRVEVDGVPYRFASFSSDQIVKWASENPAMQSTSETVQ